MASSAPAAGVGARCARAAGSTPDSHVSAAAATARNHDGREEEEEEASSVTVAGVSRIGASEQHQPPLRWFCGSSSVL